MVKVMEEEEVVAYTPTPTGSEGGSGSPEPRHRRRDSPTPPHRSPRRREDLDRSGGSALSPPANRRRARRAKGKAPSTSAGNRQGETKEKVPTGDDDDSEDLEFQEPQQTVATLNGGACAHASRRSFKAMKRELLAAVPTHEATRRARWSEVKLTFDQSDHPTVLALGGKLVVSPTVYYVKLRRVLIDGGAALNIISPVAFDAI
uniref:Uncharacterized protein n=1 Tax=Oryza meridionalis TaxID=40149 RepID=A0A0E0EK82_9ORYZ